MADTKLSALTALGAGPAGGDQLYLRDVSEAASAESKSITIANLLLGLLFFDGVVDADGNGNWTTLQAGDDALDAADYTMVVKAGTYAAGLTVSTDDAKVIIEPGAAITGNFVLSGDNVTLIIGGGADIIGTITLSGTGCSLICEAGVDIDGIVLSGNFGYVNGGGWDTLSNGGTAAHGASATGTDCIVENIALQTTGGGAGSFAAAHATGVRTTYKNVKVVDSDLQAFRMLAGCDDSIVEGCVSLASDDDGVFIGASQMRVINNNIIVVDAGNVLTVAAGGDNSVIVGNIVQTATGNPVEIDAAGENCVVVGNRLNGAVNDASGTSTVASNDETAF
tara:strand:- start:392 stop:1402 length:1011 start_codon:yes stop_codon:yes gene_type:complete